MHELVGLFAAEHDLVLAADERHRVDQERDPEVLGGQAGPHERVEQVGGRTEVTLVAELVELTVLGQEGEPVREDHGRAEVIQEV